MDNIISFGKGIRRQPSIGEAGELSELVNLIPKNGELVNVREMVNAKAPTLSVGEKLLAVHDVYDRKNYITYNIIEDGFALYYRYKDTEWKSKQIGPALRESPKAVTPMGNVLVVLYSDGYKYALWKDNDYHVYSNTDIYIGAQIKNTYGIDSEYVKDVVIDISGCYSLVTKKIEIKGDKFINIFQQIDSAINNSISTFLKEGYSEKEIFKYVSFGVAALKGYDGEYLAFSNIFSLDPTIEGNGITNIKVKKDSDADNDDDELNFKFCLHAHSIAIDYSIPDDLMDIIQGVDVFLTLDNPLYDYEKGFSLESPIEKDKSQTVVFPVKSNRDIVESIDGLFFKSIFIDKTELKDAFGGKKEHRLRRVTGTEQTCSMLMGDMVSIADLAFVYNSRYHIASKRSVFKPSSFDRLHQIFDENAMLYGNESFYNEAFDSYVKVGSIYKYNPPQQAKVVLKVDVGGKTKIIKGDTIKYPLPPIISYPSSKATVMEVYIKTPDGRYFMRTCKMEQFDFNEQSVYINNSGVGFKYLQPYKITLTKNSSNEITYIEKVIDDEWKEIELIEFDNVYNQSDIADVEESTKIIYSAVGNPMVMQPINAVNVGQGDIVGISTAAKALSQGQFGQFPLYVFCTDGIWALEVSSDGTYSAKQPISRDVCNNADSITQIDGAVVFTTDQGLKLIQGSEVALLSGAMDGHNVDEHAYFPERFFATHKKSESDGLENFDALVVQETRDFRQILATCNIAYDYPNQLLRIFPKGESGKPYKYYVYSLESREFACEESLGAVNAVVAGYPTPLVQIGTTLYTFGNEVDNNTLRNGLLLTRPIDMGEPFAMKKLRDLRMHYTRFHEDTKCKVVVFVSNDNRHWFELTSLRQGSYKYYRFGVVTTMSDDDRLSGMAVRYDLNRTNKLR